MLDLSFREVGFAQEEMNAGTIIIIAAITGYLIWLVIYLVVDRSGAAILRGPLLRRHDRDQI